MTQLSQAIEVKLLEAVSAVEEQVDQQMYKLSKMDDDDLDRLRQQRMNEFRTQQAKRQELISLGHGTYDELPDERAFFDATKKSNKLVCHFYRPSTERCKIVDKHLELIAPRHINARFVCVNVDKFPFLTERLRIHVIPTIAIVIDSKTVDYIRGFSDLGGTDEFCTETLEWRLAQSGVINYDGPSYINGDLRRRTKIERINKKAIRDDGEDDSDDY
ncbi:hypothetical protein AB6A40_007621 [Gnathostoma spinigerum]|uniref:Thioredoxin domain-containing protein 9 n=1 Tax=Gnathostoma spinigerum TaxID=75299 RepID=A0ABD6EW58_9BILA